MGWPIATSPGSNGDHGVWGVNPSLGQEPLGLGRSSIGIVASSHC